MVKSFCWGTLNARVGISDGVSANVVGAYGEETRNKSGKMLIDCLKNLRMVIFNGRDAQKEVEYTRVTLLVRVFRIM